MAYHYSSKKREESAHALPNIEVWQVEKSAGLTACPTCAPILANGQVGLSEAEIAERCEAIEAHDSDHLGWYWQACFPGCLPDSEASGPFATELEAIDAARDDDDDDNV